MSEREEAGLVARVPVIRSLMQPRLLLVYLLTLSFLVAATFAVSSRQALSLNSDEETGSRAAPYLGLTYVQLSHELAARYGLRADTGVLITEVSSGSPASRAGLQRGDILISVDGEPLTHTSSLVQKLMEERPGATVSVEAMSGGRSFISTLTLAARQ